MKVKFLFVFLLVTIISNFLSSNAFAQTELGDVVCAATLPCSPPAFEVFDNFKSGPCAPVYKAACDRWKEVKSKADALDIAADKLTQCMQEKKKKKSAKGKE